MTNNVNQKINALLDAFPSDTENIDLIVQALREPVREIRETAYWLLTEIKLEAAKQALRNYLPYAQMHCLHKIKGYSEREPNYFLISTDKKLLLSNCHSKEIKGYAYQTIKVWDLPTGDLKHTVPFAHEHMGTGDNGQIIVGHFQNIIGVWKRWEIKESFLSDFLRDYSNQTNVDIGAIAVSEDCSMVACGELGPVPLGLITVWNLQTQRLIYSFQWHPIKGSSNIRSLRISPDKSLLLSQEKQYPRKDKHRLWSLRTGELIREFDTSPYWFADAIAVRPDGTYISSGMRDNSVKVWDINTYQITYSFLGCSPTAMTPDGKVLAYCDNTNNIVLWDLDINQKICTLSGNRSPIQAICLSSNREWVVSYDADQTIKIYGLLEE